MILKTVNVIQQGESINSIYSFTDDEEGNREAEQLFTEFAADYLTPEETAVALDDGWFTKDAYTCTIIHSLSDP